MGSKPQSVLAGRVHQLLRAASVLALDVATVGGDGADSPGKTVGG